MENDPFHNTRIAVLRYRRFVKWWQKRWTARVLADGYKSLDSGCLRKLLDLHELYLRDVVGLAFHRDTHWYNTMDHCLLVVRSPRSELPMLPKWLSDLVGITRIVWEV